MDAERISVEHPGIILKEEFRDPLGLTQHKLAEASGIPKGRISEIIHGKRAISAETGIRLSRALGLSDGYFYGLQTDYDVRLAQRAFAELGVGIVSVIT